MTEEYQNLGLRKTKNIGPPPPGHKGVDKPRGMWLFFRLAARNENPVSVRLDAVHPGWRAFVMNRTRLVFFLMLVLPFWPSPSAAADRDGREPVRMDEVVVTASPIIEGNRVSDFGGSSTVVTEEQIADLNAQDLPSALRLVPGVAISRHNPIGSFGGAEGGSITIRGMGSSRPGAEIQTLVDGIPKFVSVWSHPLMDTLSIDPVERIEIYKGAQPLQFGNSARLAAEVQNARSADVLPMISSRR